MCNDCCYGRRGRGELLTPAVHTIFEADDIDVVLLIDASNAFSVLNRATTLHNIWVFCPVIAVYAYRKLACLFVTGGIEILSAKGTTQGDLLTMVLYALSVELLIMSLWVILALSVHLGG